MTDQYRKCKFNLKDAEGHGRFQVDQWEEGWFQGWSGTSEWPMAIVEDKTGKVYVVMYSGIRFTEGPE